jgi:hypothetical protein
MGINAGRDYVMKQGMGILLMSRFSAHAAEAAGSDSHLAALRRLR